MKKFVVIFMVIVMILAMTACGKNIEQSNTSTDSNVASNVTESPNVEESNTTEPVTSESSETTSPETTKPAETSKPEETTKPVETSKTENHIHNWNPVYKTVHHDAVTHTVHHDAEYKEEKTLTGYYVSHQSSKFRDGTVFDPYDYNYDLNAYNNAVDAYQIKLIMDPNNTIDTSFSCPAVYHTISVEIYNAHKNVFYTADPQYNTKSVLVKDAWDETVVDKAAYDEKVVDYYKCDCGATK